MFRNWARTFEFWECLAHTCEATKQSNAERERERESVVVNMVIVDLYLFFIFFWTI